MAEKLQMMALSPTMDKGTIHTWHIKEGDKFSSGDILCDVETDKTTMDFEAPDDGTLLKIIVNEGGQASVGDAIAIYGEKGEDFSTLMKEIKKRTIIFNRREKKKKKNRILTRKLKHLWKTRALISKKQQTRKTVFGYQPPPLPAESRMKKGLTFAK